MLKIYEILKTVET